MLLLEYFLLFSASHITLRQELTCGVTTLNSSRNSVQFPLFVPPLKKAVGGNVVSLVCLLTGEGSPSESISWCRGTETSLPPGRTSTESNGTHSPVQTGIHAGGWSLFERLSCRSSSQGMLLTTGRVIIQIVKGTCTAVYVWFTWLMTANVIFTPN